MLLNRFKKTSTPEFDFTKKISNIPKKKTFSKINSFLSTFFLFQIIILSYDTFLLESKFNNKSQEINKIFEHHQKLNESLKSGNQEDIINNFIKIKMAPFAITDLLSASIITKLYINDTDKENKKDHYNLKINPDTQKTLISIYNSNINSGINQELNDKIECFIADLSCFILKPIIEPKIKQLTYSLEEKVNIINYDIAHPEEFKEWHKNMAKKLNFGSQKPEDFDTPGKKYFMNQ